VLINASLKNAIQPKYLINFSAIGSVNYVFASTFGLTILAVAGIPPLSGFFSKFFILHSVIGAGFYFTALIVIFFSSIACFYYIRFVKIMFFGSNSKNSV
jgi:NADH-quinone oxidoreductase subunit N